MLRFLVCATLVISVSIELSELEENGSVFWNHLARAHVTLLNTARTFKCHELLQLSR